MDFLKTVGGKIVGGLVGLAVLAAGISWWQMDPSTRQMLLSGTGHIVSWFGVVLFVPWATFFLIGKVAKLESNAAGGALVLGYTVLEAILLAWLFSWKIHGPTAITFFAAAGLIAGVYNLLACDWIAERFE
jgi:FtsH-binding integral membrane protein